LSDEPYYELHLDLERIANRMFVEPELCPEIASDGRVWAPWARLWVHQAYERKRRVKMLTDGGVTFQFSKNLGSKRATTRKDLRRSIEENGDWVVCDINDMPRVLFCPVSQERLQELFDAGQITPSGLTREAFYKLAVGFAPGLIDWKRYPLT
jgi:hypothetical protein